MRYFIFLILISLVLLSGCGPTGNITADLEKNSIKSGSTTTLTINGKNTGDSVANFFVRITPEDSTKVVVTYPRPLEYTLDPNEEIGDKIINVQAFTDYTSTTYNILVELVNSEDGKVVDKSLKQITVNK